MSLTVCVWQITACVFMSLLATFNKKVRNGRTNVITCSLLILVAVHAVIVKLPVVYQNQIMTNPFTWKSDEGFCRLRAVTHQLAISTLPLVILSITIDTLIWVRNQAFYETRLMRILPRLFTLAMPWLVAAMVTLGIMLHIMPGTGKIISGRCLTSFTSEKVLNFMVIVLLFRFFVPIIGIIVSTTMVMQSTYRKLHDGSPATDNADRDCIRQTAISVCVMSALYICLVCPHYFLLLVLKIPGLLRGHSYLQVAQYGSIVVSVSEAFWNVLPVIWFSLQWEALRMTRKMCCCERGQPETERHYHVLETLTVNHADTRTVQHGTD